MGLGYANVGILTKILQTGYSGKKEFTVNDIVNIFDEFMNNSELYMYDKQKHTKGYIQLVNYFISRMMANFDNMILLTGQKGTGKSSFAIMLASAYCKILGIRFSPKRHMAYTNAQVIERIKNLDSFEPLICDEAINFASADDWAKSENKELVKELGKIRTKHLFFILCWPLKMLNISPKYRNSYVNYWVDVYKRGSGAIFVKDFNPNKEVWNMKAFDKIPTYNEFTAPDIVEGYLKKHPNFWQQIRVPKPSEKKYKEYLEVRENNVYNNNDVMSRVTKTDVARAGLILSLKDLLISNSSVGIKRILLHIKQEYGITIAGQDLKSVLEDAKALCDKMTEVVV